MAVSMKNICQIQIKNAQRVSGSRRLASLPVRHMKPSRAVSNVTAFMDSKDSTAAASASTLPLTVSLKLSVAFGEHIRLVGEKPELGSWEIDAAPELSWNEGDIWSVTLDLPAGFSSEYKIVHFIPGQAPVWEYIDNRMLSISQSSSGPVVLDLTWCEPSSTSVGETENVFTDNSTDSQIEDGLVTPAFQSAVSSVAAFFGGSEEKMAEQGSEDVAALEAAFEANPALKETEEEEKTEEESVSSVVEAAVVGDVIEDSLATDLAGKPTSESNKMFENAAKTAGALALGVAGAALFSALAIDVADTAILGAVAAAAGGAVLSGSGSSTTKASRKISEDGEEGEETTEDIISQERNITGAGETGVIIAAGLAAAFDAGRSMVDSMTTSSKSAAPTEEESTKMEEE